MSILIRNLWREYPGVAAIFAGAFVLWLLLAPALNASVAVEGLILAAAVTAWSRLADL
jgi:hypothetical protein